MGTLSSTNRTPDSPRARPGHRAVSIRMDCVLVYCNNCLTINGEIVKTYLKHFGTLKVQKRGKMLSFNPKITLFCLPKTAQNVLFCRANVPNSPILIIIAPTHLPTVVMFPNIMYIKRPFYYQNFLS